MTSFEDLNKHRIILGRCKTIVEPVMRVVTHGVNGEERVQLSCALFR